jgi:hypothetical protein
MADLGAIGYCRNYAEPTKASPGAVSGRSPCGTVVTNVGRRAAPVWSRKAPQGVTTTIDTSGTLSGAVRDENGNLQYGVKVLLIYKPGNVIINAAITDANGGFSFAGYDKTDTGNFICVAVDDTGSLQSQVLDKLTPV